MRRCEGWGHLLKGSLLCPHQFGVIQPQITRRTRWGKERLSEKSGINQVFEVAQLFTHRCTQCCIVNSYGFNLVLEKRSFDDNYLPCCGIESLEHIYDMIINPLATW